MSGIFSIAGLSGRQAHQRHPCVDSKNEIIRQVEVKLVEDEKEKNREKVEELFHEDRSY